MPKGAGRHKRPPVLGVEPLRVQGDPNMSPCMTTPDTPPADPEKPSDRKARTKMADLWSSQIIETGYTIVPSILLWGQGRLELTNDQLVVLIQLISHRWTASDPHPSKERIANRVGRDPRTVQRHLSKLEEKGFLTRIKRTKHHKGQDSNGYDLTGLIGKLNELAPEFKKVLEQEKLRRARVERPRDKEGRK